MILTKCVLNKFGFEVYKFQSCVSNTSTNILKQRSFAFRIALNYYLPFQLSAGKHPLGITIKQYNVLNQQLLHAASKNYL